MKARNFMAFSYLVIFLVSSFLLISEVETVKNIEDTYEWGYLKIGGGGFV